MISGLMEASLFDEVISFHHRMRCNSCIPNVVTYRTLLSGFLEKKQLGWCKRIINMMMKEGCNPNPSLFHSLVHSYCNAQDYSYAYKLLTRMVACGCPPGYVVYNIFIGSICGEDELPGPDLLAMAEKVYEEMLTSSFVLNKVNTANFARCLCGVGKFDKAFQIIKVMMTKGFVPDTSTYSKVITFLCQAMKVEKAFLLFQ
jgi:pentatricopeptide repeat protein